MSAVKYFEITKTKLMHALSSWVGEGLLPECSVGDPEWRRLKLNHAWQLTPCCYRSLTAYLYSNMYITHTYLLTNWQTVLLEEMCKETTITSKSSEKATLISSLPLSFWFPCLLFHKSWTGACMGMRLMKFSFKDIVTITCMRTFCI